MAECQGEGFEEGARVQRISDADRFEEVTGDRAERERRRPRRSGSVRPDERRRRRDGATRAVPDARARAAPARGLSGTHMSETSVSQEAIYRARPTLRFAGEEDIRASELILAMRMEENEGGMSTLELRLSNLASTTDGGAELAFGADSKLKLGAAIEVYAGDEAQPREIFRGHVTAIEADFKMGSPPELTVLAEDALAARADGAAQQDLRGHGAGRRGARDRRRSRPAAGHRRARLPDRHLGADQRERSRLPAPPARALRRRRAGRRRGAARLAARRRPARRRSSSPSTASWRARGSSRISPTR